MTAQFVHLHLHTEYSMVDGIVRIKPLLKAVREQAQPAVAITDRCNLFGMVKFYRAALNAGIKPLIGAELLIANPDDEKNPFVIVLLCQNKIGYRKLTELISQAYLEGQHHGIPLIEREWIDGEGLLALSGGRKGDIGQALLKKNKEQAKEYLACWQKLFPGRFYLEISRTGRQDEERYLQDCLQLAEQSNIPVVATNEVCFLTAEDFEAHEARVCIHDGHVLQDPKRPQHYSNQQYLRSTEEMLTLFADVPQALTNTVEIAKRCNLELELGKNYLPNFPVPKGVSVEDFLASSAAQGLEQRLNQLYDTTSDDFQATRQPYDERLNIELDVINKMGFPGYFLIVADFIQWSKDNAIPVGPGRGSGAGSLVAYSLGITDLDPLAYDLLFERFLNPERVSMPDFDIDFCMDNRDRVIEYVAQKYGHMSVSQIITYGSMAAKAVVRDVGRVLSHPYGFVDKLAKLIPFELGITLDKALAQEEALRERYEQEEEVQILFDLARKLEGITRNAGKHAGGVVIAPSQLTDFVPLYCEQGSQHIVTQFDKDDVEAVGLVKFDFLGLRTLTIIDWALQTVNQQRSAEDAIDINLIPTDDETTFDLLKRCETTAIFQLESRGMKDLIKRLEPGEFEDIIALVALFRPGPLQSGMVDDFMDRKHGRAPVEYLHPALTDILKPTYGIILYQEQVMQIAQVLAGYSLGEADLLRRAMGKKKPEEMAKQREIFQKGAKENGVDVEQATHIFDLMEKFAGYGFNKSHSAAYALVSYQTAWLKAHYPAAFMAAVLSSDMDNTDKVVMLINECQRMKLDIVYPDINQSHYKFTVKDDSTIIYGLGAIKGVGEAVVNALVESREQDGDYQNLFELCNRLHQHKINRRVLEALIKSGSMDGFGCHRASLMASNDKALQGAVQSSRNQASGQHDLFGSAEKSVAADIDYVDVELWPEDELLQGEKETLGLYVSGHPIERYQRELTQFTTSSLNDLKPSGEQSVVLAGFIIGLRTMLTKRGDRMAFVSLDDGKGRIEMAVFSDAYQLYRDNLVKDNLVIVEGDVSIDDYSGGFRLGCRRLLTMEQAREAYANFLQLNINQQQVDSDLIEQLKTTLSTYAPGGCPVTVKYHNQLASTKMVLGKQWFVRPADELIKQLQQLFTFEEVQFHY